MAWSWHRSTTSNLAVSLTAILLVSGSCNNGMEMVLTTQRPTSQYRSPPSLELEDDRPVRKEQVNSSRPQQYTGDGRSQYSIRSSTKAAPNNKNSNNSCTTNTSISVRSSKQTKRSKPGNGTTLTFRVQIPQRRQHTGEKLVT